MLSSKTIKQNNPEKSFYPRNMREMFTGGRDNCSLETVVDKSPDDVVPLREVKSKVIAALYQDISEHFMIPSSERFYREPAGPGTCPH